MTGVAVIAAAVVTCRIGSSEMVAGLAAVGIGVTCRIGSSEIEPPS